MSEYSRGMSGSALPIHSMSEAQRTAVMHGEGPMLVLAGPGSGKTFTITNRISYLMEHYRVRPEEILVITFTKEAALSMQERFLAAQKELRTAPGTVPVNFGTFHAIFYQIIRLSCNKSADSILRDSEKKRIIIPIVKEFKRQQKKEAPAAVVGEDYEDAVILLSAISYYKNTGELQKAAEKLSAPWKEHFRELLDAYESVRRRSGRLDFDDMVYECLRLLEGEKRQLQGWRSRFRYILIDEFQDINPMQYKVIRLLAGERANLFCVGDDDQSIYGFRGSEPSLMKQFLKDYPQAKQVLLGINYRSGEEIVKSSLSVINQNRNRFPKELEAHRRADRLSQESAVRICGFPGREEQYSYLVQQLRELIDSGAGRKNEGETAVLFRTNMQMQGFASRLSREGISYSMKEKSGCIYDHFIAKDIRAYLKCALGERQRSLFLGIMNKPSRWISREALTEEEVDFDNLKKYYRCYAPERQRASMVQRIERLERELELLSRMKPYLGMEFIRRRIGYEEYLEEKAAGDRQKWQEWKEMLDWLTEDARGYESHQKWLHHQEEFRREMEEGQNGIAKLPIERAGKRSDRAGKQSDRAEEQDNREKHSGVRLMTVHASKGLEFSRVYIPDVNEGIYPHGRLLTAEEVEEERRILYVAMTRAKEALELLFAEGSKECPGLPSRFLNPLWER